jgi:hypothetical protein
VYKLTGFVNPSRLFFKDANIPSIITCPCCISCTERVKITVHNTTYNENMWKDVFNSHFIFRIENNSKINFKELAASIIKVDDETASSSGVYQTTCWHILEKSWQPECQISHRTYHSWQWWAHVQAIDNAIIVSQKNYCWMSSDQIFVHVTRFRFPLRGLFMGNHRKHFQLRLRYWSRVQFSLRPACSTLLEINIYAILPP